MWVVTTVSYRVRESVLFLRYRHFRRLKLRPRRRVRVRTDAQQFAKKLLTRTAIPAELGCMRRAVQRIEATRLLLKRRFELL